MVLLREFKYTFNAPVLNIWSSLPCLQQPAIRSYTELLLSTQFISDFEANISAKCQSGETCVCVCVCTSDIYSQLSVPKKLPKMIGKF